MWNDWVSSSNSTSIVQKVAKTWGVIIQRKQRLLTWPNPPPKNAKHMWLLHQKHNSFSSSNTKCSGVLSLSLSLFLSPPNPPYNIKSHNATTPRSFNSRNMHHLMKCFYSSSAQTMSSHSLSSCPWTELNWAELDLTHLRRNHTMHLQRWGFFELQEWQ